MLLPCALWHHAGHPPSPSALPADVILVYYTVNNTLQGQPFHCSTNVTVPNGSTLLEVMEVAAKEDPSKFR